MNKYIFHVFLMIFFGLNNVVYAITPLMDAINKQDNNLLQELIKKKHDVNEQEVEWRKTALHSAAWLGNVEAVRMLLEAGADRWLLDRDGHSVLHMVVLGHMRNQQQEALNDRYTKVLELIIANEHHELGKIQNKMGDTIMHMAVRSGDDFMVKTFKRFNLYYNLQNNDGFTPSDLVEQCKKKLENIEKELSN